MMKNSRSTFPVVTSRGSSEAEISRVMDGRFVIDTALALKDNDLLWYVVEEYLPQLFKPGDSQYGVGFVERHYVKIDEERRFSQLQWHLLTDSVTFHCMSTSYEHFKASRFIDRQF